jgi:CDP-diacylglycerol---serine O-phosphatidyltransferase
MRPIRPIAVLPTMFTLGNLVCGFFAIVVVSRIASPDLIDFVPSAKIDSLRQLLDSTDPTHNLMLCGLLIFLAMLFDTFDGQVARLTRTTSDFGGQLDSLSDTVSFGVAPAILLVKMCPDFSELHKEAVWTISALFACCASLRLARYNVETDEKDDHGTFSGLPSPAAAAVIASLAVFSYTLRNEFNFENYAGFDWWLQRLLPPCAALIAVLMVSRIPYPHIVTQLIRGRRSFTHIVALLFAIMALLMVRWFAVPILCFLYVAVPALRFAWQVGRTRGQMGKSTPSEAV